jgi:hypothetical protein
MISFPKKWYAEFLSKYILARELEIQIFWFKIFPEQIMADVG